MIKTCTCIFVCDNILICDVQTTVEGIRVKAQTIILFDLPRDTPRTIFGRFVTHCIIFFTENSKL